MRSSGISAREPRLEPRVEKAGTCINKSGGGREREGGTNGGKVIGELRPQSWLGSAEGERGRTTEHGGEWGEVGEQDRVDGGGSGEEAVTKTRGGQSATASEIEEARKKSEEGESEDTHERPTTKAPTLRTEHRSSHASN